MSVYRIKCSILLFVLAFFITGNCFGQDKERKTKITEFDTSIESVSWSPDGKYYITTNGNKLHFWNSETDEIIDSKSEYNASLLSVKISPDGKSLVKVYNDNTFVVEGLTEDNKYYTHQGGIADIPVLDAVFYQNYYTILLPLDGQNIYKFLCLLATNESSIKQNMTSEAYVYSLDIDASNENLLVTYSDGTVKVINIETKRIEQEVKGNDKEIIAARFNRSGSYFLYSADERTLKVKAVTGTKEYTIKNYDRLINTADFSPNGKAVVAADKNGFVKIYNLAEGYVEDAIELGDGDIAYSLQFAPGGDSVLIGTKNGKVIRWIPKYRKLAVAGYGDNATMAIVDDSGDGSGKDSDTDKDENGEGESEDSTIVYKRRPLFDGKGGIFNQVVDLPDHNIYIGAGFGTINSKNFLGNVKVKAGYKNYGFYPFFWGGTMGFDLGLTSKNFPYKYQVNGEPVPPPMLLGFAPTAIGGIHYLFEKPKILVFAELGMGVNIRMLASTKFVGSPAVSFFSELQLGAQWKFLRAEIDAQIDTSFNFSFNGSIGCIISLPEKNKKKGAGN